MPQLGQLNDSKVALGNEEQLLPAEVQSDGILARINTLDNRIVAKHDLLTNKMQHM